MKKKNLYFILIGLNIFALVFYFLILNRLLNIHAIPANLFATIDAREYYDYSQWIAGGNGQYIPYRTFFYPFIVLVTTNLTGSYGLWIFQIFFWLASCNLTFYTLLLLTKNGWISVAGFIACCTNISLIGYSAHALSEIIVFFLLSSLLFILAKNIYELRKVNVQMKLLGVISLLAATKPVYQTIWYICVIAFLILNLRELRKYRAIFLFFLVTSPVLIQKSINIVTQETFSSTQIAESNLKKYFYRKVKFFTEQGTINDFNYLPDSVHNAGKKAAASLSVQEVIEYLVDHPKQTLIIFWDNLKTNIGVGYPYGNTNENAKLSLWSNRLSGVLMNFHIGAFILWSFFIFWRFRNYKNPKFLFILISGIFLYQIYLSSGLVYWAGDRLVAPAIALWVCCYFVLAYELFDFFIFRITPDTPVK